MSPQRLLLWSLIALALSIVGLLAIFLVGFAFFTHQGNDMDWTYGLGGFFVLTGAASAFVALVSGLVAIRDKDQ